ncbi:MAG: DUF362 domain-containing protein [Desulfovibrio sp.]|jgi:uncharacterized protein (DUF362 family)|nr:DUF362 domain-containing protein [Desulfovibrio sp.]
MSQDLSASRIPVALLRQENHAREPLQAAVERLFRACGADFAPGTRVLVKPNLVSSGNARLSCTHAETVRAVCAHLLDCGARVRVADSPAFGSAERVARACGMDEALRGLGLRVASLGRPEPLALSRGGSIGVSRTALEADRIISVARLKAHGQFRVTAGVKNLFGCVCGCRKALAHMRLGETPGAMESMVLDVMAALPPALALVDGIVAMHRGGPVRGEPFRLGLLGASAVPMALDTVLFSLLGQTPGTVPLWAAALSRGIQGADPASAAFPLDAPGDFDAAGFVIQERLDPMRFEPLRFVRGRLKSLLHRFG